MSSVGSSSLHCALKAGLPDVTISARTTLVSSSKRMRPSPEFQLGKRVSSRARQATTLQNSQAKEVQASCQSSSGVSSSSQPGPAANPIPVLALAVQEDSHAAKGCSWISHKRARRNQGLICNAVGSRSLESYGHLGPYEATVIRVENSKKKVGNLESELNKAKLALAAIDKLRQTWLLMRMTGMPIMRLLPSLKTSLLLSRLRGTKHYRILSSFRIFMEGWLAYLTELRIPEDNPTWAKAALKPSFPESPKPYSPLILLGFNEEEYMNQLPRRMANRLLQVKLPASGEAATEEARKASDKDPPLELYGYAT
ncbi:hypothetical protein Acr_29g0002900 [Actinidia rufa]|uniref:Uncharacterized protein n=1 Tax=Actinidia rufa TaxID=165716 RepID=A0A7J0HDI9_9ERIC|nr:hypothetical protein Acr_29g0002900 [Actinidia rufa]